MLNDMLRKTADFIMEEHETKMSVIDDYIANLNVYNRNFELLDEESLHHYAWEEVEDYVSQLSTLDFSSIYGVPRGGLIIATMLSYRSGKPILSHPAPGCLIVDDACNTGTALLSYLGRFKIACMWMRNDSPAKADYIYNTDLDFEGVVFPWQKNQY